MASAILRGAGGLAVGWVTGCGGGSEGVLDPGWVFRVAEPVDGIVQFGPPLARKAGGVAVSLGFCGDVEVGGELLEAPIGPGWFDCFESYRLAHVELDDQGGLVRVDPLPEHVELWSPVESIHDEGLVWTGALLGPVTQAPWASLAGPPGHARGVVARQAPDGSWAWAAAIGGPGSSTCAGLAPMADGGAMVACNFDEDEVDLGPAGRFDLGDGYTAGLVARVDAEGAWQWARTAIPAEEQWLDLRWLTQAADGTVVVIGGATGGYSIGPFEHAAPKYRLGGFVAAISPAGEWRWVANAASTNDLELTAVTASPGGEILVAGVFSGVATFGDTTLNPAAEDQGIWEGEPKPDVDRHAGFVAALSPAGDWRWAIQLPCDDCEMGSVVARSAGGTTILGSFRGRLSAGKAGLRTEANQERRGFRLELDPAGRVRELLGFDGAGDSGGYFAALAGDGALVVTGSVVGPAEFWGARTLGPDQGPAAFVWRGPAAD